MNDPKATLINEIIAVCDAEIAAAENALAHWPEHRLNDYYILMTPNGRVLADSMDGKSQFLRAFRVNGHYRAFGYHGAIEERSRWNTNPHRPDFVPINVWAFGDALSEHIERQSILRREVLALRNKEAA